MSIYNTLASESNALYKDKGSKFIAYAFPIDQVEQSKLLLEKVKKEHPKARHFCSALLLGAGNEEYYLTNDDGEPSNSAGAPILGQIRSHELSNVYIVVVRYFGGTKLGVGGLISAYKTASAMAIEQNKIVQKEIRKQFNFEISFSQLGDALAIIDKNQLEVEIENKTQSTRIIILAREKDIKQQIALFDRLGVKISLD